jgi:hypothetical protein
MAWVFSSPVGANPDEPSHLAYAWSVATGQGFGGPDATCTNQPCPRFDVDVLPNLIPEPACYAFDPRQHAGCAEPSAANPYPTHMTRYPPPFYLVVGSAMRLAEALGVTPQAIAYVGRLTAAAISLAFLIPAGILVLRRRPSAFVYVVAPITAMTLFMVGSVNPSGLEISAAIAAGAAAGALARQPDRRALALFVLAVSVLAWARPVAWLWAGAAMVAGLAMARASTADWRAAVTRFGWAISIPIASTLMAIGWFVYALGARAVQGAGASTPNTQAEQVIALLLRWGGMARESIGVLGWLDTPLPDLFLITAAGLIGYLVVSGLSLVETRPMSIVVAGYFLVVFVGVNVIMLAQDFLWQGRYVLPPMAFGLVMLGQVSGNRQRERVGHVVAPILWAIAVLSSLWVYARYAYGLEFGARFVVPNLEGGAFWSSGIPPLVVIGLALMSCLLLVLASRRMWTASTAELGMTP